MNKDFILPDIGEGVVECELVEWLVNEGDRVEEDQAVADVMTDKALVQIPAPIAGIITKLHYQKGDIAKVHAPLYSIDAEDEAEPKAQITLENEQSKVVQGAVDSDVTNEVINIEDQVELLSQTESQLSKKAIASPAVRRIAKENELDLSLVAGSGKNGRVYKEDIERYLHSANKDKTQTATCLFKSSHKEQNSHEDSVEPIRGVKAMMARQMMDSVSSIPHFTYCDEFDVTELLNLKQKIQQDLGAEDFKISLMPFFIKALSLALTKFPILNSQVNDSCTEITYKTNHNIGFAVDSKIGLLVPNIKNVQQKNILQIAHELNELIHNAREGSASAADLKSGTITISNIGALGGTVATPIINKPEVAIVALGRIQKLPRFDEQDMVQARHIMQISWSGDHRIIDGATMAQFCNLWKSYLESPASMLLTMC